MVPANFFVGAPNEIPKEDLESAVRDFAVDCKACRARLAAAEADLTDEKVRTVTLGRERDSALRAARGGSAKIDFAQSQPPVLQVARLFGWELRL